MTQKISSISQFPNNPAVYALYGGRGKPHVAYVGMSNHLKTRITQHLVRRDSSVTTGVSPAALIPDHVTEVHWWEAAQFAERTVLEAAEMVYVV